MTDPQYTFTLQVGWFTIRVDCSEVPAWFSPLRIRFSRFITANSDAKAFHVALAPGQTTLSYTENKLPRFTEHGANFSPPGWQGEIDLLRQTGWMYPGSSFVIEEIDYYLRVVTALQAYRSGGILFHAAGIVRSGNAYVFFGHSGAGKTTISRLSGQNQVMNDDLILLRPTSTGWCVYSTPFFNPSQVIPHRVLLAPLTGLYCLAKDSQVYLEKISTGQALAEMIANIPVISADHRATFELLSRCQGILATVPVFRLHFRKDDSFWDAIEHGESNK